MQKLLMIVILAGSVSAVAQEFPVGKFQGVGGAAVSKGSNLLRGLGVAAMSLTRSTITAEIEFAENGRMSVRQIILLGIYRLKNRYDVLWTFESETPSGRKYRLINATDGVEVGKGFCVRNNLDEGGILVCDYTIELPEQKIKITERLEVRYGEKQSYDLIGSMVDNKSWWGSLEVYYRVQLVPPKRAALMHQRCVLDHDHCPN